MTFRVFPDAVLPWVGLFEAWRGGHTMDRLVGTAKAVGIAVKQDEARLRYTQLAQRSQV